MSETEDYATTVPWTDVTGKPTEFAPEAHASSHKAGGSDELLAASYVNRWTRPGRLYASDGTTLKQITHISNSYQATPENGDRLQMFFICSGNETILTIGTYGLNNCGIYNLYVNGVLDSSGYDEYYPTSINRIIHITLVQPIIPGLNTIELRVNEKNPSSTNYYIRVYGASLQ